MLRVQDRVPAQRVVVAVRVLGGFEVAAAGRRLTRADWQRASAERLVKLLLVTPGHRMAREIAAETLWPGAEPEAGRASLRKAIHFAHQALRDTGLLVEADGSPALDTMRLDLDLDRLQAAFDRLTAGESPRRTRGPAPGPVRDPDRARNSAQDAVLGPGDSALDAAVETVLALGSLELLPDDLCEDWLVLPRERLRSRWQRVALEAAGRAADGGHPDAALDLVDQMLGNDPTDEAVHRLAIRIYAASGRHHAARRQLELCRQALRDGLDADLSDETLDAFRAAERTAARPPGPRDATARLVARQAEIERVEPLLDQVATGRLASLVIRGTTGIGKTRLLEEVVALGHAAGWRILEWRAVEATATLAYAPLRIAFGEALTPTELAGLGEPARSAIATLIPGLDLGPRLTFEDPQALIAALVMVVERLARIRPTVIAIDDLPWLDPSSLAFLGAVISGLADAPLLVAATYRDDEPAPPAVPELLAQVRRSGGTELALGPLACRDVEPLVIAHLGGRTVQPEVARAVHERGLGNPLFCLELVRVGRDRGALRLADGRWSATSTGDAGGPDGIIGGDLPDTVRTIVASRFAVLPPAARELLAIAAELGSKFDYRTLAAISPARDDDLLAALDASLVSGLLVETGAGYAFAHPLYRLAVRGTLGPRRRGQTCFRIAQALAGGPAPEADPARLEREAAASADPVIVAELALVAWDLGVAEAGPLAVAYGFAAGEREGLLLDRPRAAALLARALGVWRMLATSLAAGFDANAALVLLADLRKRAGADVDAAETCREAVRVARSPGDIARAYAAWYWIPYEHGDFEAALAVLEEGLVRLPPAATAPRARLQAAVGWCLLRMHRFDEALAELTAAAASLETAGDQQGTMQALDFLGVLHRYQGRSEQGVASLERSLAIALELGDSKGEMLAQIHLVPALTRTGHAGRARPHADRALELASQIGDRYAEAVAAWMAADRAGTAGDLDEALTLRRRELGLLASIGGNPHNEALAHAHIAHIAHLRDDDAMSRVETGEALRLAALSADAGYAERMREALEQGRWFLMDA